MAVAPDSDFFSTTALMPGGQFEKIKLEDFHGKYVLIIFYPGDFNPHAVTEIRAFAFEHEKFTSKNCQVLVMTINIIF